eukprot:10927600-Ditylum_brightwellii.AAC.1
MAFMTESLMVNIYSAIPIERLTGEAHTVVAVLQEKYAPKDLVLKIEMKRKLNAIAMKKTEDPVKLFEQISGLENHYNTETFQISLDDQLATVLDKAPEIPTQSCMYLGILFPTSSKC